MSYSPFSSEILENNTGLPFSNVRSKIEIECRVKTANTTEVNLTWREGPLGCSDYYFAGASIFILLLTLCGMPGQILLWLRTPALVDLQEVYFALTFALLGMLAVALVIGLFQRRRKQNKSWLSSFWSSIGWDEESGHILKGEIVPTEGHLLIGVKIVIEILLLWFALRLFNVPSFFFFILVANKVPQIVLLIWPNKPFLRWKAYLLEDVSMLASRLANILIFRHVLLTIVTLFLGLMFYYLWLASNNPIELGPIIDNLSVVVDWREIDSGLYFIGLDEGRSDYSYGQVTFALMEEVIPQNAMKKVALLPILCMLSISMVDLVSTTILFVRTPSVWKKRYGNLFRIARQFSGIKNSQPTKIEQSLFTIWVAIRWILSTLTIVSAMWIGITTVAWLLFGWVIPGSEPFILAYSFYYSGVSIIAIRVLLIVFAFLHFGPLLIVVFLALSSWLQYSIAQLLRYVLHCPRGENKKRWVEFLEKYELPQCRLTINKGSAELAAVHFGLGMTIVIPDIIWRWYLSGDGKLNVKEIELLLLHEVGHLQQIQARTLMRLMGVITVVGQGYFELGNNSLQAEFGADDFAATKYQQYRPESIGILEVSEAVRKYEKIWSQYRMLQKRPSKLNVFLNKLTKTPRDWLGFFFAQQDIGYVHPESELRRLKLLEPK